MYLPDLELATKANMTQSFEDLAAADKQRYAQEFKTVFQRDPVFVLRQQAA